MDVITSVVKLVDANKAKAAFLAPVVLALGGAGASWAITGEFDEAEVRTAVGGAITGAAASVAAWLTNAKEVVVNATAVRREVAAGRGEAGADELRST